MLPEGLQGVLPDVGAVDVDLACGNIVHPREHRTDSGLAAAALADERNLLPAGDLKVYAVEDVLPLHIGKRDVLELDGVLQRLHLDAVINGLLDIGLVIKNLVDAVERYERLLELDVVVADGLEGRVEHDERRDEGDERSRGNRPVSDEPPSDADDERDSHRAHHMHEGREPVGLGDEPEPHFLEELRSVRVL